MTKDILELKYQTGFGNYFSSEAISGLLPSRGNSPQNAKGGLYAEQLSGDAFTAPHGQHQKAWLYRIFPSAKHGPIERSMEYSNWQSSGLADSFFLAAPEQLRWKSIEVTGDRDFVKGVWSYCGSGSVKQRQGCGVHRYTANLSMQNFLCNADADLLLVPSRGKLLLRTEFGNLSIGVGEIALVQRGIKFQVIIEEGPIEGYICENYGAHFELPNRGAIGANGLAAERDFLSPIAAYEDISGDYQVVLKYGGSFFTYNLDHSPLDVVAWHGNYVPYKYDLRLFNTIGSISFDHPDPSIFTVLTSPSGKAGYANIDFAIFPPRWMVAEDTFRPPYFHRNIMSEFMGLLWGSYDAKPDSSGFTPGGASLHNCMSAHGPDELATKEALKTVLSPVKQDNTMAFMFESLLSFDVTQQAFNSPNRDFDYLRCWSKIEKLFKVPTN